jgi:hypothetical protein
MEARVHINLQRFRPERDPATAAIWLALGAKVFPEQGWDDFVVVILAAWMRVVADVLRGAKDREFVHFMDGPYEVEVSAVSQSKLRLRAIEDRDTEVIAAEVNAVPLVESLLAAAQELIAECKKRGHATRDVDNLNAYLPELRRELVRLSN